MFEMILPAEFYEDEVRDGFYVPGMMKRCWAAQLTVWEQVYKICERHLIPCYAYGGTLLGAVRHGGFIPWDDDMDFCMLRDDFERFKSLAERELPEGYFFLNYETDTSWDEPYTRIVNGRTACFDPGHLKKFHGFPFPAGIEIFPLDYLSPDNEDESLRESLFTIATYYANELKDFSGFNEGNPENPKYTEFMERIKWIEDLFHIKLDRDSNLRHELYLLAERISALYPRNGATEVAIMACWAGKKTDKYPLSDFSGIVSIPFEGIELPAPSGYDGILHDLYGDYLSFIKSGSEHGYPYYREQFEANIRRIHETLSDYDCKKRGKQYRTGTFLG